LEGYDVAKVNAVALIAIHPGDHLAEELKELDMSAAELARKIGVPTNRITGILNGQRAISGDTALRLARFFGTSAEFWLNLQSLYELRLAREKAGKSIDALPTLKRPVRVHAQQVAYFVGRKTS
jgi:antitoxin HigA-1